MKKIVLLSTGGTIASKKNPETGLYVSGALTGEELIELCGLSDGIQVEVESVFQIPSNQMDFERFIVLKEKIEQVFTDKNVNGIVVTHGTDTLEETSYFLDLVIDDERPVVVTGSQRVPEALGSDAYTNLRHAIQVANDPASRDMGVLVLFNERIFAPRNIIKNHASNVNGFSSPGFGYLGIVDQDQVYFYQKPLRRETYEISDKLPQVEIVKCYAGSHGGFVTAAYDMGAKGIILEGAGRGNIPPQMVKSIREVIKDGVHVILTTSTLEGEVYPAYDIPGGTYDLQNNGVILGKDYDSKKARVKLAVLLAANENDIASKFCV